MSEEMEVQVEETAMAAESEESATSEQEAETTTAPETTPEPEKKDGVQERIDALTFKRREAERERDFWKQEAMARGRAEAELGIKTPKGEKTYPDLPAPKSEDFDTYDAFVDARADYRSEIRLRQFLETQQAQSQNQAVQSWGKQGIEKHPDFQDVFNRDLPISDTMGQVLLQSKQGHDLAYHLGKNPAEAQRIYNLPASMQSYELGKLETKLAGPPQKSNTNAPTPTAPVGGKELPSKSVDDMSYDEYKAYMESRGL